MSKSLRNFLRKKYENMIFVKLALIFATVSMLNYNSAQADEHLPIKISPDSSGLWTIFQGFTLDPEKNKFYTSWDSSPKGSKVVIMQHNSNGDFELKSSDVSSVIAHGQDLGHAYYKGKFYLFSASSNGRGITVFTPPTVNGGPIENIRQFTLFPEGWVLAFPNESSDFKSVVVNAWDNSRKDNPYYTRVFNFENLMNGSDGERYEDYFYEVNLTPKNDYWSKQKNTIQSVSYDNESVYVLTGTSSLDDGKYISSFDVKTGQRLWRRPLNEGASRAAARGRGNIFEYEGIGWLPSSQGRNMTPWVGVRMQDYAGQKSEMYIMPIDKIVYGSGVGEPAYKR